MYNWSVDARCLKKNKEKYAIWKLEQIVNFGLGGEKIDSRKLKKYWDRLDIDPSRRRLLKLFLYGKRNFKQKTTTHS